FSRDWSSDVCSSDLLGVVAGVFLGCCRVVLATDGVEADGDVEGVARTRAFEEQVLEKVCRAVGLGFFVSRADRDPESDRCAARQIGRASCRERLMSL